MTKRTRLRRARIARLIEIINNGRTARVDSARRFLDLAFGA